MATILGIETSCDETGIAIYDTKRGLISNILHSQIDLHANYGGVVPELASRDHLQRITALVDKCLNQANLSLDNIDAIAYTSGPGLNGALLVGAGFACGLALSLAKPVIPIHHLEGHLLSPKLAHPDIPMPFIALLVSGGHSQLIAVYNIGEYQLLGDTLDDAAGEAFDKTAKMLGLPYPGGKYIASLATQGQAKYPLPRPMYNSNDLNMSFSGLKTAVRILIAKLTTDITSLDITVKQDIAKSIEEAITDVLVKKTTLALKQSQINTLVVCGGVSANQTLRNKLTSLKGVKVYYPPLEFCTDNGAMIAIAGHERFKLAKYDYSFKVRPRWELKQLETIK